MKLITNKNCILLLVASSAITITGAFLKLNHILHSDLLLLAGTILYFLFIIVFLSLVLSNKRLGKVNR